MSAIPMRCAKCGAECFSQYNLLTAAAGNAAPAEMVPLCDKHAPWPSPQVTISELQDELSRLSQQCSRYRMALEQITKCGSWPSGTLGNNADALRQAYELAQKALADGDSK